jgi:integrase
VWEIRVAAGTDLLTGRTLQRSVTFHGSADEAEVYRAELAAEYAARRSVARAAPMLTVGALLERWLLADHPWRPSTWVGYRANARSLSRDRLLARTRVVSLTPQQVRRAFVRWEAAGKTLSVIAGRFRVLRAAIGWAYDERIIDCHPIRTMRGPARPEPRRPIDPEDVVRLLATAEYRLLERFANDDGSIVSRRFLQAAEQDLLMIRVAADSGARRGELAGLQFSDLTGRVLTIARAVSVNQIGPTKSGLTRHLTLGTSTVALWHTLAAQWQDRLPAGRTLGPWVFAADLAHRRRLSVSVFDHRLRPIRGQAHVPDASLHRLRHSVATFLINRGEILQAQARLGHSDPATTLRIYAHALPLTDTNVADAINHQLDQPPTDRVNSDPIDDNTEST